MIPTGSRKIVVNVEEGWLPKVGETIHPIFGKPSQIVDFGHWSEIKKRWPKEAEGTLKNLTERGVPEEKLGRTWVAKQEDGSHWLYGKQSLQSFFKKPKPTGNAIGFSGHHWPEDPEEDEDEYRRPMKKLLNQ